MSTRNTPQRMTCCRLEPAASRIVAMFFSTCSVCAVDVGRERRRSPDRARPGRTRRRGCRRSCRANRARRASGRLRLVTGCSLIGHPVILCEDRPCTIAPCPARAPRRVCLSSQADYAARRASRSGRTTDDALFDAFNNELRAVRRRRAIERAEIITEFRRAVLHRARARAGRAYSRSPSTTLAKAMEPYRGAGHLHRAGAAASAEHVCDDAVLRPLRQHGAGRAVRSRGQR